MRKFVFTPTTGSPVTLGDDSTGDKISMALPRPGSEVQEVKYLRANYLVRFDRALLRNEMVWTVNRDHGNETSAMDFLRDHGPALLALGVGILTDGHPTGDTSINVRWWLNATVTLRCLWQQGQSTVFEYTVRAGQITNTSPF